VTTSAKDAISDLAAAAQRAFEECPVAAGAMICAFVEEMRMGNPLPVLTSIAEDADWWASLSTPVEMEGYLIAIARHLPDTVFHQRSRKRIIAAIFKAMPVSDKAAFLAWAQTQMNEGNSNA